MAINRGFGQDQGFSRGPGQGIGGGVGTGIGGGQGQYDFNNLAQYGNRARQPEAGLRQTQQSFDGGHPPGAQGLKPVGVDQHPLNDFSQRTTIYGPPHPGGLVPLRDAMDYRPPWYNPNPPNAEQLQNLAYAYRPHDWSQPVQNPYGNPSGGGNPTQTPGPQTSPPTSPTNTQTTTPPSPYLNPTMQSWTGESWNLNPNQFATPQAAQSLAQNTNLFAPGAQTFGINFGDGAYYQASDPMQSIAARGFTDPINAGLLQGQVDRYGDTFAGQQLRQNESLDNPYIRQQAQQYEEATRYAEYLRNNPAADLEAQARSRAETEFLNPIMNAGGDVNAARRVLASGGTREQAIQAAMTSAGSANAAYARMLTPLPGATDGSVPGTPFGQAAPGNPNDPYNQQRQQLAFNHFGQLLQNNPAVFAALFGLTGGPTPAL